jgi:hypothetical protein
MRTIVYSREASLDIDSARKAFRRLDNCVSALEWRLARGAEKGVHRTGKYWMHRQKGIAELELPEITVLYSFTDDEVEIHAVVIRPAAI